MGIKAEITKQKGNIQRLDVNYRALEALNVSMIKIFDTDPVKFFEQFKLGRKKKDSKSTALIIGDIADFYLLDCNGDETEFTNRFEEKFALYEGPKGSGQVFVLVDKLFEITQNSLDEDDNITLTFTERFNSAVQAVQSGSTPKYKGKTTEKILEDFLENGKAYFDTLLENIGKTVVESSLLDKSLLVAKNLQEDPFTAEVFQHSEDIEYFPKFPIEWDYKGIKMKSELDILKIDHINKIIYPMDLKTTYDNEGFDYNYIKNGYYLQAAFYHMAVNHWSKENDMEDYEIAPMEFIVGDTSANNRRPLRYKMSDIDLDKALYGFTLKGNYYRGIMELIDEIMWAEENNIWNCSRDTWLKNGLLNLNLKYE